MLSKGFRYKGPEADRYAGSIQVGHTKVQLEINIPDLEFARIPQVKILDRSEIPVDVLAHIELGSGLCYGSPDFLRLDKYKPGESVLRVLEEARQTIEKSFAGKWTSEVAAEFPMYWGGLEVHLPCKVRDLPTDCFLVNSPKAFSDKTQLMLCANIPAGANCVAKVHLVKIAGRLLVENNIIVPKSLSELEKWIGQKSVKHTISFDKVLNQLANNKVVVLAAENGIVGFSVAMPADWRVLHKKGTEAKKFRRLLSANKKRHGLDLYRGFDTSLDFVTQRNSMQDSPTLKSKKIAVVGCGTIGSHLARYLVQSGAGNDAELLLIDNQRLTAGNLGRHLCNYSDINEYKAIAVKNELKRFHPSLSIRALCTNLTDAWDDLKEVDLVIDAVGIEEIGDLLNAKAIEVRRNGGIVSILHVWLTGNGIGAQTFLNIDTKNACYRCLRPDVDRPSRFDMRKDVNEESSFVAPSCGEGPYTPYLVDAPIKAACLALTATYDYFFQTKHIHLRSILLDSKKGRSIKDKTPDKSSRCPACSS